MVIAASKRGLNSSPIFVHLEVVLTLRAFEKKEADDSAEKMCEISSVESPGIELGIKTSLNPFRLIYEAICGSCKRELLSEWKKKLQNCTHIRDKKSPTIISTTAKINFCRVNKLVQRLLFRLQMEIKILSPFTSIRRCSHSQVDALAAISFDRMELKVPRELRH